MQRIAKPARQWLLVSLISVASAWFGAQLTVKTTQQHPMNQGDLFRLIDDKPAPCPVC